MASSSCPVSSMETLCSPRPAIAHPSFVSGFLCSRFYAVREQAIRLPGGTYLLSFISYAAVFPDPSLRRAQILSGASPRAMAGGGLTRERSRDSAAAVARDCGWAPARPREGSCNRVAAAFRGSWKITTRIWPQASPFHQSSTR